MRRYIPSAKNEIVIEGSQKHLKAEQKCFQQNKR